MTQTLEAPAALPQNTPTPRAVDPFSAVFNRNELSAALDALAPVVRNRASGHQIAYSGGLACLSCVKLTAAADRTDNAVTLEATNREVWAARTLAQVQNERVGTILLNHGDLKDAVKELTGDTITIRVDGACARVFDDDFSYRLPVSSADEFPPALRCSAKPAGTVLAAGLARLLKQTDAARDDAVSRHGPTQAFWLSAEGERIRCSTSDGKRCHDAHARWEKAGKKGSLSPCVVPAETLKSAVVAAGDEGDVSIALDDIGEAGRISFSGDGWELSGPLVAGKPANIEDIISQDCRCKATAGREALLRRFKQAWTPLKEDPRLICTWDKRGLTLSVPAARDKGGTGTLPLKYEGDPMEIGVNAKLMIDALSAADVAEVTIGLTAPNRPMLIDGGSDFTAVVMPVSLS